MRGPWTGGTADEVALALVHGVPGGMEAINHVTHPCARLWSGLWVLVGAPPRPPPICPTIMMDVGSGLTGVVPVPVSRDEYRLLVRLMLSVWPVGTVTTTGDHQRPAVAVAGVVAVPVMLTVGAVR